MPDLIAQGPHPENRWRRCLPSTGDPFVLGRTADLWSVPWDDRISRQHARLSWNGNKLDVAKLPQARNAIFYRGQQREEFMAAVGEHFVIGQTTFTVTDQPVQVSNTRAAAYAEQTFSAHLLRQTKYRDAGHRIEALGKLPEIIAGANSDSELCMRVVNLLLQGVPNATFVAIVKLREAEARDCAAVVVDVEDHDLEVLHWDCRGLAGRGFTPSAQLVKSATQKQESVLHVWNRSMVDADLFTQSENVDWAFCTPVVAEACPGWAIYVSGNFPTALSGMAHVESGEAEGLGDDLKFTELTATTLGALRQVRALQRRQDSLRNFFAPVVLEALGERDPDRVLAPRETDVSVLFCDLRGFSKQSEGAANNLLELLQRVSDALGVMTHHILANNGVVGDFHGDAAMGFWGWPIDTHDSIERVCRAALAIQQEFVMSAAQPAHPLANFRAGLGIASGPAVAGRIGTTDQVKVTVFGPVVNLASRLEGMTKQLQATILVDEATAEWVRTHVDSHILRVRRVAKVIPVGMQTPLVVSELLAPFGPNSLLQDEHLQAYEAALDHFIAGDWHEAFRWLHRVPAEDQVKDFLTVTIAQHRRQAPHDWQGYIELSDK